MNQLVGGSHVSADKGMQPLDRRDIANRHLLDILDFRPTHLRERIPDPRVRAKRDKKTTL